MSLRRHISPLPTAAALLMLLLTACNSGTIYDAYAHTPVSGWEKNDTLFFDVPPVATAGVYQEELGLRINTTYPFMGLSMIVEQTIYRQTPHAEDSIMTIKRRDTVQCDLVDERGVTKGQGLSYYQYNFRVNELPLLEGDSIHICVRHNMLREIIPGIADVGIKLSRR